MNLSPDPLGGLQTYPDDEQVFVTLYDSAAFADFEQALDDMLDLLVGRWAHLAAPRAGLGRIRGATKLGVAKKKTV